MKTPPGYVLSGVRGCPYPRYLMGTRKQVTELGRSCAWMVVELRSSVEDSGATAVGWSRLFSAARSEAARVVTLAGPVGVMPLSWSCAARAAAETLTTVRMRSCVRSSTETTVERPASLCGVEGTMRVPMLVAKIVWT